MKKTLAGLALTVLLVVFAWSTSATATDEYIEVEWATPVSSDQPNPGANGDIWPQTLATDATCGVWLQVDRYYPGEATDALIATGELLGSHQDGSLLNYNYPFESTGSPWQFVKAPDCVVETSPTPEPEPSITPDPEPTYGIDEPDCQPTEYCGEVPEVEFTEDTTTRCVDGRLETTVTTTMWDVYADGRYVFDRWDTVTYEDSTDCVTEPAKPAIAVVAEAAFTG